MRNSILVVEMSSAIKAADVSFAALAEKATADMSPDVQEATLVNFHQRFGHLSYDTIERIAKNPVSGIRITDHRRLTCITCAQSKQTKNIQSKKDTCAQFPIDRVGGVICFDLKGSWTPDDRLWNWYLVYFVDHKSNYCRIFLAKTKDASAKKLEHFLALFEREFNFKVAVLRTEDGG